MNEGKAARSANSLSFIKKRRVADARSCDFGVEFTYNLIY